MTDPSAGVTGGTEMMSVPNEPVIGAVVNDPSAKVTLYGPENREITVFNADVEFWLNNGFRRYKLDISATASELVATLQAVAGLIPSYVAGIVGDGYIDTSDESNEATIVVGMGKVAELYSRLHDDVHLAYKVRGNLNNVERAQAGLPSVKAEVDADNARRAALGETETINTAPQPDFPAA